MIYRKSEGYFIGNQMVILSEIGWFYRKSDGLIENRMIIGNGMILSEIKWFDLGN